MRKQVTFALVAEEDDLDKVTATVEALFDLLATELQAMSAARKDRVQGARPRVGRRSSTSASTSVTVRPMSNKWASCSTAGNLTFNGELLELDEDVR